MCEIPAGDIGDFYFPAIGWMEIADNFETSIVVEVAAGDSEIRTGILGFFFDVYDVSCRDATAWRLYRSNAKPFRIRNCLQEHVSAIVEGADVRREIVEVDVIAEDCTDGFSLGKILCKSESLGDAAGRILNAIGEFTTEART